MYEIIKPKKFIVYTTTASNKKLASEVRKITGADIVINGTLYNASKWKPVCDVKVDGKILANDQYTYWGYGWNKDDKRMTMCNDINKFYNYITCVGLIKDGKDLIINANPDVARPAGRTAIGFKADGSMVVWCTPEGTENMTLTTLRSKIKDLGCVDALALDGGGSSQLSQDGNRYVYSSRRVQNYICIWKDKPVQSVNNNTNRPKGTFKVGSKDKESVKWIQQHLNEKLELPVDGNFSFATQLAVKAFQATNNMVADGIVGENTLKALE